ncbi:MAG: monofunctional biosynthetic peptidoglycan transglycosylase [Pseudomonadota bacterium]
MPEIVVIGGGASGIAAARRLRDAGADVLLLEASGRLGGRAHSVRVGGQMLDLGCGWLHSADRNPWTRIALAEGFQIDRTPSGWGEQWNDLGYATGEHDTFHAAYAEWHDRAEAFVQGPDRPLSDFIAANSPWRPQIDAISGYANGANLADVSLHDWAAYENAAGDDNWRLIEGYGTLIAAYGKKLPVRFDCPVSLVDHRGTVIRLTTPKGIVEAERVIIAVPTPIIADGDLRFDPPLEAKRNAAAALPLGLADKIFLGIRGPDYPRNAHLIGNPHSACTASYQVGFLGNPLVEAFFGGDCAEALEAQDDRAAADFAIGELAGLLGNGWRLRLSPIARTRWRAEPFIRGSYSHARVGSATQRGVLAEPHDDRLFFAGEACSRSDFSTAHGAYESGIAAAEEALAARRRPRIGKAIPPMAAPAPAPSIKSEPQPMPAKPPKSRKPLIRRLFGWLIKGALAFVVISVAMVGLYRFVNPPFTLTMAGDQLSGNGVVKKWMSLDQMDPTMPRAAIAGEDSRFCLHSGFDFKAIEEAYNRNQNGGRIRGGSTISQQTAKNVFLIQGGGYVRKGFEAYFTFLIEHLWGKRRIMEVYLNVAETGIGTYGANAGSIRYFGHDASRLSPTEAGRIAAVLPLPKKRDAIDPRGFVRRHGNAIARYVNIVRSSGLDGCLR